MRAWVFGILVMMLEASAFAAEPLTVRYEELKDYVQKSNKPLQASLESAASTKAKVGDLNQSFYPKVSLEGGIAEQKEINGVGDSAPFWSFEIQSNLYRGGRDNAALAMRESAALLKEMDTQVLLRSELYKARTLFIKLSEAREIEAMLQSSLGDYDGLKKAIGRKVQAGLQTSTALLSIEVLVDEMRRDLLKISAEEHELEDLLILALGLEHGRSIEVQGAPTRKGYAAAETENQAPSPPETKRLLLQADALRRESQLRTEWWLPDVSAFAAYTGYQLGERDTVASLPARNLSIGLRLSLDLESKQSFRSDLSAKVREAASVDAQREQLSLEITHKIHEFQREANTQSQVLKTYEEGIRKSERILKKLRSEFESGIANSSDLATTVNTIQILRRRQIESATELKLALAGLESFAVPADDR